jgi:hypothetical protein
MLTGHVIYGQTDGLLGELPKASIAGWLQSHYYRRCCLSRSPNTVFSIVLDAPKAYELSPP